MTDFSQTRLVAMLSRQRGFTLIELMIVVVIVAILLTVALPGYQNSMQKARRGDAKAAVVDVANRQEQSMLDRNTYTTDMTDLGFASDPMVSDDGHYSVDATACAGGTIGSCYLITATPRSDSAQASDQQCILYRMDSTGAKSATGALGNECW